MALEAVELVAAALTAGAAAGLTDTASAAVRDAYAGLKALVRRKAPESALVEVVGDEDQDVAAAGAEPLREEVARSGVAEDEEVVRAARRLLALVDPAGARAGKYTVTISGGKGNVVGDHARVEMTFEKGD